MKANTVLAAISCLMASAVAQFFDECFVTPGATANQYSYSFSIHELHSDVCDPCMANITAVGATQIAPGATVQDPEQVWNQIQFSSGGGFSNLFSMPSYQSAAVNAFLQNSPPRIGASFNTSGVSNFTI